VPYKDPEQKRRWEREHRNDHTGRERKQRWLAQPGNADKEREYAAEGRQRHRGTVKRRDKARRDAQAARARKRDAFVEHVDPLVVLERADGACGVCGWDVDPFDFHVDHIVALVNGGEHSYRNVQPTHPECNLRKGTT
jgi:5-methylcytosine-specific restriction endonuclease McrA